MFQFLESALTALFSVEFLLFCLGVSGLVEIFRRLVEFFVLDNPKFKPTRTSKFWREVVLPSSPTIFGLLITAFIDYPFPENLTSFGSKLLFGLAGGLTSGLVYKVVKSGFKKVIRKNNSDQE